MSEMRECARGCGLYVSVDGPRVCTTCEIAAGAKAEVDQREREHIAKLVTSERVISGYRVRTRGYAVIVARFYDDPVDDPTSSFMFANEARALAKVLVEQADFVDSLESPMKDGSHARLPMDQRERGPDLTPLPSSE